MHALNKAEHQTEARKQSKIYLLGSLLWIQTYYHTQ